MIVPGGTGDGKAIVVMAFGERVDEVDCLGRKSYLDSKYLCHWGNILMDGQEVL
jgi:hypothetical protein